MARVVLKEKIKRVIDYHYVLQGRLLLFKAEIEDAWMNLLVWPTDWDAWAIPDDDDDAAGVDVGAALSVCTWPSFEHSGGGRFAPEGHFDSERDEF